MVVAALWMNDGEGSRLIIDVGEIIDLCLDNFRERGRIGLNCSKMQTSGDVIIIQSLCMIEMIKLCNHGVKRIRLG